MKLSCLRQNNSFLDQQGISTEELISVAEKLLASGQKGNLTIEVGTSRLFCKHFPPLSPREILFARIAKPAPLRAYDNAAKLRSRGFHCPTAVALFKGTQGDSLLLNELLLQGGLLKAVLFREFERMQHLPAASQTIKSGLFPRLGRFLRLLHDNAVYHSDLHDCNLWVVGTDNREFSLLDLEAVRFCALPRRRRMKNLSRLALNIGTAATQAGYDARASIRALTDAYCESTQETDLSPEALYGILEPAYIRGTRRWTAAKSDH